MTCLTKLWILIKKENNNMAHLKLNTAQWLQLGKKLGYIKKAQEESEGGGIWWGGNYAELNIPQEAVDDIAQSGANDEAVDSWHGDIDFSNISDEQLRNELEQHDLGEENMKDRESQEKALLWMSAQDISDYPDMYAPDTSADQGGGDTRGTDSGSGEGGVDSIQNNLIGNFSDKVSPGLSDVFASKFDVALERGDWDTANFDDIVQEAVNLTKDLPNALEESDYRNIIGEALMGDDWERPIMDTISE